MPTNKMAELTKVLPLPEKPLDFEERMLARNQAILRINFPTDFIEFGRSYGSGKIETAYSWEVWSPFRQTYPLIVMQFSRTLNIFRDAAEITNIPFGIFPEVGGILPFAKTPDGDWVCWETKGEPDQWSVIDLARYENGGFEKLDLGFSEYLFAVLTRAIVLERHEDGDTWDPKSDIAFVQKVFADQKY